MRFAPLDELRPSFRGLSHVVIWSYEGLLAKQYEGRSTNTKEEQQAPTPTLESYLHTYAVQYWRHEWGKFVALTRFVVFAIRTFRNWIRMRRVLNRLHALWGLTLFKLSEWKSRVLQSIQIVQVGRGGSFPSGCLWQVGGCGALRTSQLISNLYSVRVPKERLQRYRFQTLVLAGEKSLAMKDQVSFIMSVRVTLSCLEARFGNGRKEKERDIAKGGQEQREGMKWVLYQDRPGL